MPPPIEPRACCCLAGIQTDPYASAWSPDGHWLAGTTYPGDGAHDLTLLDMSTDPPAVDRTRLEDYYPMSFLVWSPDSTRLIVSGLGAETAIYEVQTGALTPLIALQGSDRIAGSGASWSPDGQQIAFAGMNNNGNYYYLYVVNVDGTELHQVIDSPVANYPPFWMPDGQQVMVNTYPPPEIRDLALVNVNTGTITPVIHDSSALYRPVALLDLSHLLASGYSNDPDATEQVYVIDLTTGDSTWIQTGVADVFYLQRVPW
ncbi:MAG: hypothetical protein U0670_02280 [Anaerolineae bacterium]